MKNINKGSIKTLLLITVCVLIVGFGWYFYNVKNNKQTLQNDNTETAGVEYIVYTGNGYTFEYPKDWIVKESYYATPAQQDAGHKGDVVALQVVSQTGKEIVIGGRQAQCGPSTPTVKSACFKNEIPITTTALDTQSMLVFDHIVATLK